MNRADQMIAMTDALARADSKDRRPHCQINR
jgi:hypothetical protein